MNNTLFRKIFGIIKSEFRADVSLDGYGNCGFNERQSFLRE